jgi:signal transduction histidine kinase
MKTKIFPLFSRILVLVFSLITLLSLTFMCIAYFVVIHFFQASTQLLNKDVAAHIAKFTSPFEQDGLNKQKADSVFYQAMVISPSVEVYFLDTTGKVIYYHGVPNEIRLSSVSLESIHEYLNRGGQTYIKGQDPRDPSDPKIFSAAPVNGRSGKLGYIYVVLGSTEYRHVSNMLFKSHAGGLLLLTLLFILLMTVLLTLWYVNRLQRNYKKLIGVLEKMEEGDLGVRFPENENNDLKPVTNAFNQMAGQLQDNMDKLKKAELERKEFTTNISHDLRTPLAIARGFAETLFLNMENETISVSKKKDYSSLIVSNIQAVEHMVQQLLDLSKMEAAGLVLEKQPFVFSEIVQEFIHSVTLTAMEKKISLAIMGGENASWISADIRMMERVVQNLLTNAIKFTAEAGQISISLISEPGELIFQITNSGEAMKASLFQWLSTDKRESSVNRPYHHGLGLVIVKTTLQLHHFPIEAGYVPNAGNRISFRMPVNNPSTN